MESTNDYYMSKTTNKSTDYQLINDLQAQEFYLVNYVTLGQAVNLFGIVSNLINVAVFLKMGFKDTSNITLMGLTLSDLFSLVSLTFFNLCQTPAFYQLSLPFEPYDVAFLTVGWMHVGFARITCCLTAVISLERCLCVTLPLKVKDLITPRRKLLVVVLTFPLSFLSILPIFCTASLTIGYSPARNRTLVIMTYNQMRQQMESVSSAVNNIIPVSSFVIIVVSSVVIVSELQRKAQWRKSSSAGGGGDRQRKLEKMVVLISAIFIVCYLPCEILFVWMLVNSEIRYDGKQSNLFKVSVSTLYLAETLNASSTTLVYLTMSSKYRGTLRHMITPTSKSRLVCCSRKTSK